MTNLAVNRLFASGGGRSGAEVEIEDDHSAALRRRVSEAPAWRSPRTLRLLGLTPFAVPIAEMLLVRDYFPALVATPPAIVGAPLAFVLELMLLLWAALGAAVVWRTGTKRVAELAVLLFAPTAIVGLILRPAVIQVMRNLPV